VAVVAVSVVVYGISFVLTRALSRYRELAADRAAALLTGRPSVLAAALTKLSGEMAQIPTQDLRQAEPFNAFFFAPALAPGFSLSSVFSTHPSLAQRLEQLAELSVQLSRGRNRCGLLGHVVGSQQIGATQTWTSCSRCRRPR